MKYQLGRHRHHRRYSIVVEASVVVHVARNLGQNYAWPS